ncbi:hypothetical protein [Rhodosalinus sp. 5P4]|uniref:hypothetical protein n=1 Tax=Rhodosalinus sp. 5P4 TaxID=3239196 RepID=UPI003524FB1D
MRDDSEMWCNLCGGHEFMDMNRRAAVKCTTCLSLERTRALELYLARLDLKRSMRILQIAPDKGLYDFLSKPIASQNYVAADFDVTRYEFLDRCAFVDLCDLDDWLDNDFDIIIHRYVLVHTPCDIGYSMHHLDRMFRPEGHQLCVIPIILGHWDESFADLPDEERTARFGQFDHVRRLGAADIARHLGAVIRLPDAPDLAKDIDPATLQRHNIPEACWTGFNISTVLDFRKGDYLLS